MIFDWFKAARKTPKPQRYIKIRVLRESMELTKKYPFLLQEVDPEVRRFGVRIAELIMYEWLSRGQSWEEARQTVLLRESK